LRSGCGSLECPPWFNLSMLQTTRLNDEAQSDWSVNRNEAGTDGLLSLHAHSHARD
jgi:hypothetical protein